MRNWWQIKQAAQVVAQNLLAGKGAADQILELPLLFMIHVTSQKSYKPQEYCQIFATILSAWCD